MRLDQESEYQKLSLDITPLIDIVFLLVMFFAVSTSFISGEDLQALKTDLLNLGTTNQQLQSDIDDSEAKFNLERSEFNARIVGLSDQLESSEQAVGSLQLQVTTSQSEAEAAAERERALITLLSQRESEIEQLESKSAALDDDKTAIDREMQKLKLLLSQTEERLSESTETKLETERQLSLSEDNLRQLNEALATQLARQNSLEAQLEDAASKERLLEQLIAERVAELDDTTERLSLAQLNLADLNQQRSELATSAKQMESKLQEQQNTITSLRKELSKFEDIADADRELITKAIYAQQQLTEGLGNHLANNNLNITRDQQQLILQLSDKILFASGSTTLTQQGLEVLRELGQMLKDESIQMQIQIGGHTDNVPVSNPQGPLSDNWGLSAARSVNVVKFFEEALGISPDRMAAVGYGQHRPIADNSSAQGRAANRRIEIVLIPR